MGDAPDRVAAHARGEEGRAVVPAQGGPVVLEHGLLQHGHGNRHWPQVSIFSYTLLTC